MARTYPYLVGAKVRLREDVTTRGGTTFRKGVVMNVTYQTHADYHLSVSMRGKRKGVTIRKCDALATFTVIQMPPKETPP